MKKILLAVTAALAITGCSQNEEFDAQNASNEIKVGTIVNNATRANLITNSNFNEFTAYAYAHATGTFSGTETSTVIPGAKYEKPESTWSTTDSYFWPADGSVTFLGYGGATAVYTKATGVMPTLAYEVADTPAEQKDLVVAQLQNATKATNPSVNLPFKHALTQVYFKLMGANAELTYEVTGITIKQLQKKGTFTYGTNPDASIGSWVNDTETLADYSITLDKQAVNGTETVSLSDASQVMILLPQELTDIEVEVTYSAKQGVTVVRNASAETKKLTATWTPGQKIAYVLKLSVDKIDVTGSVGGADDGWVAKADETPANKN